MSAIWQVPEEVEVYTVSQLNREVRVLLEDNLPLVWITGEISNLRRPGSGHIYFSLKDEYAQVSCALFRMRNNQLDFEPKDGQHVTARARVGLYEERGSYQLIIEQMFETGSGALQRAFEALKKRLAEEGLFDAKRKRSLPSLPRCIGVVTSASGAAIRDILTVLKRRFAAIPVIIYPCLVQGLEAAAQIVAAIQAANARQECDVLIVARGGGSLEDLWPFNEEMVARAIYASDIPIVTGIGHEIDFTIADFVADQRAATPSAAAELVSPYKQHWLQQLQQLLSRLMQLQNAELRHWQTLLAGLSKRLQHPGRRLEEQAQRLDNLERDLIKTFGHLWREKQLQLQRLFFNLQRHQPQQLLQKMLDRQENLAQRLQLAWQHLLEQQQQHLNELARALDAISPLNTLKRGYAIVTKEQQLIKTAEQVTTGDKITARLMQGSIECVVSKTVIE